MIKRQLKLSKQEIPLLGFGAAPLGGLYGKILDAKLLVEQVFQAGINYFDTSPYYGDSEEVLGECLKCLNVDRSNYLISSKVGRSPGETFNYSPEYIKTNLKQSLRRLKTDYLDIYLLHDIEYGNLEEIMTTSVPYLQTLKREGLIKHIGFSTFEIETVKMASKYMQFTSLDILLVYGHNNLINHNLSDIKPLLEKHEIDLIDASPLSLGLLRDNNPPDWHPTTSDQRQLVKKVADHLKHISCQQVSLSDIALYYTLTNMVGVSLLVGLENLEQLQANLNIYQRVLTIGDSRPENKKLTKINGISNELMDDYLSITIEKLKPLQGISLS